MSKGEVPVAGKPHHEAEYDHEKGDRVAKGEEIDHASDHEDDSNDAQEDPTEKPKASEGEDGDADRG